MSRRGSKAGHKRRSPRSLSRRVTRSQARGHVKARKRQTKAQLPSNYRRIEDAIREINRGRSLTAAARSAHISRRRLSEFLTQHRLGKRKGRRWVIKDNRPRRVPVMTRGRLQIVSRSSVFRQCRASIGPHR
jgi:hypothetical protein